MDPLTWTETRFLPVPLTAEELQARGEHLAELHAEQTTHLSEHKVTKAAMREAEADLVGQMARLAALIRARAEFRPVALECRLHVSIGLVEEVRLDTGEIVRSRGATDEDRRRAGLGQQRLTGLEAG